MKETTNRGWKKFGYFWMSFLPLTAYMAISMGIGTLLTIVVMVPAMIKGRAREQTDIFGIVMEEIADITMLAGAIAAAIAIIGLGLWYYFGCKRKDLKPPKAAYHPLNLLIIAVLAYCMQYAVQILIIAMDVLLPQAMNRYEQLIEMAGLGEVTVLGILYGVILGPIAEELVLRGLTMYYAQKFTRRFWLANILQAVLFGVLHMNLVQGVYAAAIGLVLGWVYHRFHSLYASIWLHIVFNFLSFGPLLFLDSLLPQNAVFQIIWCCLMAVAVVCLLWVLKRRTAENN